MELTVQFRWKVVVLDDDRIKEDSIGAMTALGVDVVLLGRPKEALLEAGELLVGVHFAYCDMYWPEFGKEGDTEKVLSIPNSVEGDPVNFVKAWVSAIRYWLAETAPEDGRRGEEWPQYSIDATHVGLWLAAMVKHLSPEAEIILHSSRWDVTGRGALAAIGRFPNSPFAVLTKNLDDPLRIEDFMDRLKSTQKRYLKERSDIRRWFLSDVLIPTIAGDDPSSTVLMNVGGKKNDRVTFKAETFFPNFINDGRFNPTGANELLEFLGTDMPGWQEAALHSLKHKLLQLKDAKESITEDDLRISASLCNECGEAGTLIRNMIEKQSDPSGASDSQWLAQGLQICHASLSSREADLIELCRTYGGKVVYKDSAQDFQPGQDEESKTNPQLPFQYFFLRRTVDALVDNARKYAGSSQVPLTKKLEAEIDANTLTATWSDSSSGFLTLQTFRERLVESVKGKGGMRGLPLALLFGLRFNAMRIEVMIRNEGGSGGNWHSLWPYGDNSKSESNDGSMSFGFRWTFKHEVLP